ncbi:division/cell wall cluster transcriptional repressor MraZ [Methylomonas paludis]|uniref:Transcriptional regulator MraZ n=1 Tax=Methylomonas paludis TaxID=1173101 RepID=A0A975RBI1_9GAMM|nr:division/cell wall cluster transcriptional repressor MraZ [Methylomonas paludis]QWF72438.1 division/cell wall cluster transcriptional repressor MraZ [Methylomonas paludis]
MFRGINTISLDAKGRIAIPTRYRDELQDSCERQLIVTIAVNERSIGEPGCLWLYPLPEWEQVEQTISKLSNLNKMSIRLKRFLIGNATECEMDNQGRLMLPDKLREFAKIKQDKQVLLVGQLTKFEIWNEAAWQAKEQEWLDGSDNEGLEELGSLSF